MLPKFRPCASKTLLEVLQITFKIMQKEWDSTKNNVSDVITDVQMFKHGEIKTS